MLSRFHLVPERNVQTGGQTDGRTDGRTDRFAISISRVSMLTRDKNGDFRPINRFFLATIEDRQHSYNGRLIGERIGR